MTIKMLQEADVKRKSALFLSGIVTAFVMVVVIGLVLISGRAAQVAQAATVDVPTVQASDAAATDVATLQAQVQAYKQALQKRDADLQSAYNQIQTLNDQLNQLNQSVQQLQSGGFNGGGFGDRRSRGGGFNSDSRPFFGGGDD